MISTSGFEEPSICTLKQELLDCQVAMRTCYYNQLMFQTAHQLRFFKNFILIVIFVANAETYIYSHAIPKGPN